MGGGHGVFAPAIIAFPWATLPLIWQTNMALYQIAIAAVQFPVYGMLLDSVQKKLLVRLTILIVHIVLVILVVGFRDATWK